MNRDTMLQKLQSHEGIWDILIIGGGATGLGIAVDAAARGYKTLLLEQHDFAKGTSSRSTKLVHGGVRYLQQGDISLVLEALKERGLMIKISQIPSWLWSFWSMVSRFILKASSYFCRWLSSNFHAF